MRKHLTLLLAMIITLTSWAQGIQKQEKVSGLNAFTYYPVGYETGKKFPLILFFPGKGEAGTDVAKLLAFGPAKFIASGYKPDAIVVSVQQPATQPWISEATINNVLTEAVQKYQVDTGSIHMTGFSAGAVGVKRFAMTPSLAGKIKSIVLFSAPEYPALLPNLPVVAKMGVSWLGFCGDREAEYLKMRTLFEDMTKAGASAKFIVRTERTHCCWNNEYNPSFKVHGTDKNIYEWMLTQGRTSPPPVDTTTKVLQILHDPAKVQKIIILDKDGRWTEYQGNAISTSYLKLEFQ